MDGDDCEQLAAFSLEANIVYSNGKRLCNAASSETCEDKRRFERAAAKSFQHDSSFVLGKHVLRARFACCRHSVLCSKPVSVCFFAQHGYVYDSLSDDYGNLRQALRHRRHPILHVHLSHFIARRVAPARLHVGVPRLRVQLRRCGLYVPVRQALLNLGQPPLLGDLADGHDAPVVSSRHDVRMDGIEPVAGFPVCSVDRLRLALAALRRGFHPAQHVLFGALYLGDAAP